MQATDVLEYSVSQLVFARLALRFCTAGRVGKIVVKLEKEWAAAYAGVANARVPAYAYADAGTPATALSNRPNTTAQPSPPGQ